MQDFNNKVAVITGGASGVGRSLAFELGRRGAKIAVGDVDKNAMSAIADDLAAENIEAIVPAVLEVLPWAHVLVVDDNSPDGTGALADALAADDEFMLNHTA